MAILLSRQVSQLRARFATRGSQASTQRPLHFSVWGAQMLLASFFALTASLKLVLHYDRVVEIMAWAAAVPPAMLRVIGVGELLAAIVVAAPVVTRAPQRVVGWTAMGLVSLMAMASAIHIAHGEVRMLPINLAVAALAAFVAWGRLAHDPLETDDQR